MSKVNVDTTINTENHVRNDYQVQKTFLNFPNQQKKFTFVNGTSAERTITSGTLFGIISATPTIAKELAVASVDGSQIPKGFLLYDTVIPAGVAVEVEALVGVGDDKSSIFEDGIVLNGAETLESVIVDLGITIRHAITAYTQIKVENVQQNISEFKDTDV